MSGKPLKIPRYLCLHLSVPTISGFYNISLSLPSFLLPTSASVRRALCFSRSKWPYTAYQSPTLLTIAHLRQGDRREEASLPFSPLSLRKDGRTDGWMAFALTLTVQTLAQDRRGRAQSLSSFAASL